MQGLPAPAAAETVLWPRRRRTCWLQMDQVQSRATMGTPLSQPVTLGSVTGLYGESEPPDVGTIRHLGFQTPAGVTVVMRAAGVSREDLLSIGASMVPPAQAPLELPPLSLDDVAGVRIWAQYPGDPSAELAPDDPHIRALLEPLIAAWNAAPGGRPRDVGTTPEFYLDLRLRSGGTISLAHDPVAPPESRPVMAAVGGRAIWVDSADLAGVLASFAPYLPLAGPAPADLPAGIYPPPVPPRSEGFGLSAACPDPSGLERPDRVGRDGLLAVIAELDAALARGDLQQARRLSDPAYWPYLSAVPAGAPEPRTPDAGERYQRHGPAADSPHGDVIAAGCGEETRQASWWVAIGPAAPQGYAGSLLGHFYLVRRAGRWLVWAAE